ARIRRREMVQKIDGSMGEGGGQVVRTALSLAMLTGREIVIEGVRAGRRKPGLLRQHLAAARAAAEICSGGGACDAELGAQTLRFAPGEVRAGEYGLRVGSAGSAMLVLQTVLLPLCLAGGPSRLELDGGTHNPWAPTFDFLERSFLPLLRRMGPRVEARLERPGFYPAGGGRAVIEIEPASRLSSLHLEERGEILSRQAVATVANLRRSIGVRELQAVARALGWGADRLRLEEVSGARGPGNALRIEICSEHVTEVFTGFGRASVPAEQVAKEACRQARAYLSSGVPVGPFLADQLLLPMALAGDGSFRAQSPSRHCLTQIELLRDFLGTAITAEKESSGRWLVRVGKSAARSAGAEENDR
ncbi:MAG: RNA 3'-terminal phosphate cyclase, partial [Acidobacteriota bacterium]